MFTNHTGWRLKPQSNEVLERIISVARRGDDDGDKDRFVQVESGVENVIHRLLLGVNKRDVFRTSGKNTLYEWCVAIGANEWKYPSSFPNGDSWILEGANGTIIRNCVGINPWDANIDAKDATFRVENFIGLGGQNGIKVWHGGYAKNVLLTGQVTDRGHTINMAESGTFTIEDSTLIKGDNALIRVKTGTKVILRRCVLSHDSVQGGDVGDVVYEDCIFDENTPMVRDDGKGFQPFWTTLSAPMPITDVNLIAPLWGIYMDGVLRSDIPKSRDNLNIAEKLVNLKRANPDKQVEAMPDGPMRIE